MPYKIFFVTTSNYVVTGRYIELDKRNFLEILSGKHIKITLAAKMCGTISGQHDKFTSNRSELMFASPFSQSLQKLMRIWL